MGSATLLSWMMGVAGDRFPIAGCRELWLLRSCLSAYLMADAGQKGGLNIAGRRRPVTDQQRGICSVRQREGDPKGAAMGSSPSSAVHQSVAPVKPLPKCTFCFFFFSLSPPFETKILNMLQNVMRLELG
jgi:hypothetical protein